jgi:hypothetical protein
MRSVATHLVGQLIFVVRPGMAISAAMQRPSATQIRKRITSRRQLRDPFDQELQVALNAPQIDVLGWASRQGR